MLLNLNDTWIYVRNLRVFAIEDLKAGKNIFNYHWKSNLLEPRKKQSKKDLSLSKKSFKRYLLDRRKKHWPIIFLFFWYWYYFVTPINVLFCRPLLINWKLIKWMIFPTKNNYFEISVMFFEKNMKIIFFRKLVLTDILAKM